MAEWWNPSRRVERWWQTIGLVLLVVVIGPSTIHTVTTEPTTGNWVRLAIWLFATAGFAYGTVQAWRNRNKPQSVWWEGTTAPPKYPPTTSVAHSRRLTTAFRQSRHYANCIRAWV